MTDYMLFLFINKEAWKLFSSEQREELVDHELCHFSRTSWEEPDPKIEGKWITVYGTVDDPDSWSIREHDVEEFSDIIDRHGLWETGIEQFAAAVREAEHQMNFEDVNRETKMQRVK